MTRFRRSRRGTRRGATWFSTQPSWQSADAVVLCEGRRRASDVPMEAAGKVALIGEAYHQRDFRQRQLGHLQKVPRLLDARALHIGHWGQASAAFEQPREVEAADMSDGCELREPDGLAHMLFDIACDVRQCSGVEGGSLFC